MRRQARWLLQYFPVIIWLAASQMTRNTRIHFSSSARVPERNKKIKRRLVGFNRLLMCDMFLRWFYAKY
jgi:cytidylate kinase